MELQDSLAHFSDNRIRPFAISYDPVDTLRSFAEKHDLTYALLSDEDSAVIQRFGILNTLVPQGHRWYGVPFPGTYIVDENGRVTDRSFHANHGIRDAIPRMLRKSLSVDPERGPAQQVETDDLTAIASLTSGTIRRGQIQTLALTIDVAAARHIYGPSVEGGYIPTRLTFDPVEDVIFGEVDYPGPETVAFPALDETLPVYTGQVRIEASVLNRRRDDFSITARLGYQACDDRECYPPADLVFEFFVKYLGNA